MLLRYFYDKALAQGSYLVGCQASGEGLVIDPSRDIEPYLKAAAEEGLAIRHVTETHIHADFVSGSRELAARTGARLYLSDMGDADWKYGFADANTVLLRDGDEWKVGNVRVKAIATPGHTPEHLVFQITDTASADEPMGLFTGDCLFVGALGRPDLLEEAAGMVGTKESGARQQFRNIQWLKTLPDYLQIWPGHGAGSACGKSLGAVPSTTLGYEKRFNPSFHISDEDEFVHWLLEEQPEPPRYFAVMKRVNKVGPALLGDLPAPQRLDRAALDRMLQAGVLVIDARPCQAFAEGHLPGTLNVPGDSNRFSTYVGSLIDVTQAVALIAPDYWQERLIRELRAIGVDLITGVASPEVLAGAAEQTRQISPLELARSSNGRVILDVRGHSEYMEMRLNGARHIPLGYLPEALDELPRDLPLVVHCQSGVRSQVAASFLLRRGFTNVENLTGGIDAWAQAGLEVERGRLEFASFLPRSG
jgi:hydroxyacylglutathione hydrolase